MLYRTYTNFLYPFGILTLTKVKNIDRKVAEKEFLISIDSLTNDYMDFMRKNGVANQSFIEGTFLGDDLTFCNEIRSAAAFEAAYGDTGLKGVSSVIGISPEVT